MSLNRHADYTVRERFSLCGKDVPPLLQNHSTAVGLDNLRELLRTMEPGPAHHSPALRSHVAVCLTEMEREKYLE